MSRKELQVVHQQGNKLYAQGKYSLALPFYHRVLMMAVNETDSQQIHRARINIVFCHILSGNVEEARLYLNADRADNTFIHPMKNFRHFHAAALICNLCGELESAQTFATNAINLAHEYCDNELPKLQQLMARIAIKQNKFDLALAMLDTTMSLARNFGDTLTEIFALQAAGEIKIHRQQFDDAACLFEEAQTIALEKGLQQEVKKAEFWLAYCDADTDRLKLILPELEKLEIPSCEMSKFYLAVSGIIYPLDKKGSENYCNRASTLLS